MIADRFLEDLNTHGFDTVTCLFLGELYNKIDSAIVYKRWYIVFKMPPSVSIESWEKIKMLLHEEFLLCTLQFSFNNCSITENIPDTTGVQLHECNYSLHPLGKIILDSKCNISAIANGFVQWYKKLQRDPEGKYAAFSGISCRWPVSKIITLMWRQAEQYSTDLSVEALHVYFILGYFNIGPEITTLLCKLMYGNPLVIDAVKIYVLSINLLLKETPRKQVWERCLEACKTTEVSKIVEVSKLYSCPTPFKGEFVDDPQFFGVYLQKHFFNILYGENLLHV